MKNDKMILYVQTSDQPERQYSPLVLAQSAKAMDLEPAVYFLGMGLKVLKPGAADAMQLGSLPERRRDAAQDASRWASPCTSARPPSRCSAGRRVELIDGVKIVGAATLNDLALDAGATMWF